MKRDLQGRYQIISTVGEPVRAFIPAPLPPNPPLQWTQELRMDYDQALLALGRLDSVSTLLPDQAIFLYSYIRKEAVVSSMIEGTQSSVSDLMMYEMKQAPGVPIQDVQEVSNYVQALNHGLMRLKEGMPLSLRLLREIHEILLADGRGHNKTPGQFRQSQNWIGGTRPGNAVFVPPPPNEVMNCMGSLELFLHDLPEPTPALIKAALAPVQFETIHPFLDGNGRLGRLLITLLLCEEKVLHEPLLYLSLYFKTYRQKYYELLDCVRKTGDWEAWLSFFIEAVRVTATQAVETAQQMIAVSDRDRERIRGIGQSSGSVMRVHRALTERPVATTKLLTEMTGYTPPTVNRALLALEQMDIVREITGRRRNRAFTYVDILAVLNQGAELPEED